MEFVLATFCILYFHKQLTEYCLERFRAWIRYVRSWTGPGVLFGTKSLPPKGQKSKF